MASLTTKTAIGTGGAKGIGRHYSKALAAEGARVMIADKADGKELAEEIAARHGANSVANITFDVSDETAVKSLVAQTLERFGHIDVLVNNAAVYSTLKPTKVTDYDVDLGNCVMAVNVRGSFLMVKHVAPHMKERRSGKIINIASAAAYKGIVLMLPYVASKGALLAFTRALSRELGDFGISVNSLAPASSSRIPTCKIPPMSRKNASKCATAALLSVTPIRKTCSARWFFSPPAKAILSPDRPWRWTAARSILKSRLFGL
jgi:NAD(P)-dependent dehydrogenase (short-subunit alcohol dehydrogenase family)